MISADSNVHLDETSPIDFGSAAPLPDESVQDMDGLGPLGINTHEIDKLMHLMYL